MSKYYYTCPIKALHMLRQFKVQLLMLDFKYEPPSEYPARYDDLADYIRDFPKLVRYANKNRIYVDLESEAIFEPKEGDIGIEKNLHSVDTCYFGGKYWAYENEERRSTPHQQRVKIILREGKQFFMPEVENDQITKAIFIS